MIEAESSGKFRYDFTDVSEFYNKLEQNSEEALEMEGTLVYIIGTVIEND